MASERVARILIAKDAPFTPQQIESMNDGDGWAWIYANRPPGKKRPTGPQICFTGFGATRRAELEVLAAERGFHVAKSVTKGLTVLCAGDNAGPMKLERAALQGVTVLNEDLFLAEGLPANF